MTAPLRSVPARHCDMAPAVRLRRGVHGAMGACRSIVPAPVRPGLGPILRNWVER